MTRSRSIARKLLLRFVGLILLAPVLVSAVIFTVGEQGANQQTNAADESLANALLPLLHEDSAGHIRLDSTTMMKNPQLRNLRLAIYGSASADPVARWPSGLRLRSWDELSGYDTVRGVDGRAVRVFFAPADEWKARLDWYWDEFSDEALPIIAILMGVTLPLSFITIRRGLAPVRGLAAEAGKIDPGEEHARLSETDVPFELLPLVKAVNHGLERLDAGLASQRRFSAIVAHELRTPLAILLMQLEREQQTPGIAEAKRQTQRLHRLVEQLLVISELSARRLKLDTVVDMTAMARETIGQEAPRALDDRVTIALEGPEQRFTLRGNAAAIGAALRNLVNNAVRHSPTGGHVLVRLIPTERAVEVSDEGSGVDVAARSDIFEPFWKKSGSKGAGVGLAIVREMAALHGGRVSLRDNEPHGSIFRIDFDGAGRSAFCSG